MLFILKFIIVDLVYYFDFLIVYKSFFNRYVEL